MKKYIGPLTDDAGSIVLMVLMILSLLTLVGIAATSISNTEVRQSGNNLLDNQNFYLAEGAVMQAVEELENNANPKYDQPDWLEPVVGTIDETNVDQFWDNTAGTIPELAVVDAENHTRYLAVSEGIDTGSSLGMNRSRVHAYTIYGRSDNKRTAIVRIGYLKAF